MSSIGEICYKYFMESLDIQFSNKNFTISTKKEFYSFFNVHYQTTLTYKNEKVRNAILQNEPDLESCFRGMLYQNLLYQMCHPPISIGWISKEIGFGVFAKKPIEKGQIIGMYTGVVQKVEVGNPYQLAYQLLDDTIYVINAKKRGNFTRFVNHSYTPNLEIEKVHFEGAFQYLFISSCAIEEGGELTINYGKEYWEKKNQTPRR